MCPAGGYGLRFSGGPAQNTEFELLHQDLNYDQGTGITAIPGSIAWCENYAVAKSLASAWSAVRTFKNQFSPTTMGVSIPEWNQELSIVTPVGANIPQQQAAIASKFLLVTQPPTNQQVTDFLKQILGNVFVDLEFYSTTQNLGSLPGGVTVPGGVTLPDGAWSAPLNKILVRIWQPRDKNNNLLMTNAVFNSIYRSYFNALVNYLPAFCLFQSIQYQFQISGTLTATAGSNAIVGSGTTFTTQLASGKTLEIVDDQGNLNTVTVNTITDDTHLTISKDINHTNNSTTSTMLNSLTGCVGRRLGFFLDNPQNLDNWLLQ